LLACRLFQSLGKKADKNYWISSACAEILRQHFKFPDRLFYRLPEHALGSENLVQEASEAVSEPAIIVPKRAAGEIFR
jgi:hypothetical protein